MTIILLILGAYMLIGLLYGLWGVFETGSWDPGDGWLPIWQGWALVILLWPLWLSRYLFG